MPLHITRSQETGQSGIVFRLVCKVEFDANESALIARYGVIPLEKGETAIWNHLCSGGYTTNSESAEHAMAREQSIRALCQRIFAALWRAQSWDGSETVALL